MSSVNLPVPMILLHFSLLPWLPPYPLPPALLSVNPCLYSWTLLFLIRAFYTGASFSLLKDFTLLWYSCLGTSHMVLHDNARYII